MFFFLSKTLDFFLMPIGFISALLIYAYFTKNRAYSRRTILGIALLLYVLCNTFLVNKALLWWEFPPKSQTDLPGVYDVGIVLTGGMISMPQHRMDHPGLGVHADRFFQAFLLYKSGKIKRILISGADHPLIMKKGLDDANQAAMVLEKWGVRRQDILLEKASRNTYQNAVNSIQILQKQFPASSRYVLITSSFHLRRALGCFQKAGLQPDFYPADVYGTTHNPTLKDYFRPDPDVFGYAHLLWREWVGYVIYKIVGYC
ncbi:YdcF family protein [Arundinibacter roseus]|uniref:YdcF family protein n=1 Tax=Arundinibacter roseus TaxID=2070510 RepID=A0A4R4K2B0_9BACT|nr:YdcF family protein [Arundinibacter roseus]TDB61410.1 YdcF family protein [Arundinibacter roseus]